MSRPIEDYALLGDCRTAALVAADGSVDWLCLPRFDGAAVFAAILGDRENGCWRLFPLDGNARATRSYRDGTMVLDTVFETAGGRARVTDFLAIDGATPTLVRIVEGLAGTVRFGVDLVMRFDYGRTVPWVERLDRRTLSAIAGPDRLVLRTEVELHGEDLHTVGEFAVSAGDRVPFTLSWHPSHGDDHFPAPEVDPEPSLAATEAFWTEFAARCPDVGAWTPLVRRSLATLKALTYTPTGGIVAAPTTSLPEWIGGPRNWDYRFCWLRDATFTLQAFMGLGYFEEARQWRDWLLRAVAGDPAQTQIMYGLGGERQLPEQELPWLAGYAGSLPVRIGNAAAVQRQTDIFGEVADALARAARGGIPPSPRARALRTRMVEHLDALWRLPDEGIWETRGGRQHFVHSKVMAWVAFDRTARAEDIDPAEAARWRAVADEVHAEVCARGFDAGMNSFVQHYGATALDASLLHMPLVGFLPPDDPRMVGTVAAVEQHLLRDGLVLRYDTGHGTDGLPAGEGAFLACSFWLADAYVLMGRRAEAAAMLDRLCALANDVGLLAEEYDPQGRRMLGNFPQAFSHVGLINTALNLARAQGPAHERADGRPPQGDG